MHISTAHVLQRSNESAIPAEVVYAKTSVRRERFDFLCASRFPESLFLHHSLRKAFRLPRRLRIWFVCDWRKSSVVLKFNFL